MDIKLLCEMLPQPVFLAKEGKVAWCNSACFDLVAEGMPLCELMEDGGRLFSLRSEGELLQLPVVLGGCEPYNAYVGRTEEGELFVATPMEKENSMASAAVSMAISLRRPVNLAINSSRKLFSMIEDYDDPILMQEAASLNRALYQLMRRCSQLSDGGQMLRRRQSIHREKTDLRAFFRSFLLDVQALLAQEERTFDLRLSDKVQMGDVDSGLLERALYNLLSNSLRFTPRGGTIVLSVEKRERELLVRFTDDGEGFSPSVLATIYDRFEDPFGDPRRGIGLGLPIVREIVRLHDGTMTVGNNAGGKGACVTFTLALHASVVPLRSRTPSFDYCGEFNHGLVELSDVLDPQCYDPRDVK